MENGLNANVESGLVLSDAKEANKSIPDINQVHTTDKINAKALGVIICNDTQKIEQSTSNKTYINSLQVNSLGTEAISANFDPFYDPVLQRDIKCNDEPIQTTKDNPLSMFSKGYKPKVIEKTSNNSENMINVKILAKTSTQQDSNKNDVELIDDGHSSPKIKTLEDKNTKNLKSKFITIVNSRSQKNQRSKSEPKKYMLVPSKSLSESYTPKPKTTRKKTVQDTKSVDTNQRYYQGIKYLAKVIKDVVIFKKLKSRQEIAEEVCNSILPLIRDIKDTKKLKSNDISVKNTYRRVNDALNILCGASIFEKMKKSIVFSETKFSKEVYQQKVFEDKAPYNKLHYKRIELFDVIRKYSIIKHLIEKNKTRAEGTRIYLPFITIGRCADKSGLVKAGSTPDGKKTLVSSQVNLKLYGDLQTLMICKACKQIPDKNYNAYVNQAIGRIEQNFKVVPEYLKCSIPK